MFNFFKKKCDVIIKLVSDKYVPIYAKNGDAGADIKSVEHVSIKPRETVVVKTGLRVEIPEGYEIQIRPRSGLAAKYGITVLNSPGTIDSGYRGEIGVILHNTSKKEFKILKGDRIAQMVVNKVYRGKFRLVTKLSSSDREEGGFGSTGKE